MTNLDLFHDPEAEPDQVQLTAEQVQRGLAWVKAHFGGDETIGGFSCPERNR